MKNKCEYCGKKHDGTYGSGRFCSKSCSSKYSNSHISEDGRNNQIETLKEYNKRRVNKNSDDETKSKKVRKNPHKYNYERKTEDLFKCGRYPVLNEPIPTKITERDPVRQGKIGEYKIAMKFLERGMQVFMPICEDGEIDMITEFGGKLQKIQVKTSRQVSGTYNENTHFKLMNSNTTVENGKVVGKHKEYSPDTVDYFALYDLPHDEAYLIKNTGKTHNFTVKQGLPADHQVYNVNMAQDYNIDTVLDQIENSYNNIIDSTCEVIDD
jgi:uncharacterized cupredoxin-like copper-binding protein